MAKKNRRTNNWSVPRQATTGQQIIAVFREQGVLTVSQVAQRTGIHPERIRRMVRPPQFKAVGKTGEGRRKAVLWRLHEQPSM